MWKKTTVWFRRFAVALPFVLSTAGSTDNPVSTMDGKKAWQDESLIESMYQINGEAKQYRKLSIATQYIFQQGELAGQNAKNSKEGDQEVMAHNLQYNIPISPACPFLMCTIFIVTETSSCSSHASSWLAQTSALVIKSRLTRERIRKGVRHVF